MQREVIMTGIGGQGIQLSAKTLALAATLEGHQALMTARYGGEVRGGQSEASVVTNDGPLRALPVLPSTWSAYVMHGDWWAPVRERLLDGPVVANTTLVPADLGIDEQRVVRVPATEIARDTTGPLTAGFVLLGAYLAVTRLVGIDSAVAAMRRLVPPYRDQHVRANAAALEAGYAAVPAPETAGVAR